MAPWAKCTEIIHLAAWVQMFRFFSVWQIRAYYDAKGIFGSNIKSLILRIEANNILLRYSTGSGGWPTPTKTGSWTKTSSPSRSTWSTTSLRRGRNFRKNFRSSYIRIGTGKSYLSGRAQVEPWAPTRTSLDKPKLVFPDSLFIQLLTF